MEVLAMGDSDIGTDARKRGSTTRRGLLTGAVGAAAGVVSGGMAQPAQAADGDVLVLGVTNEATNTTRLESKETALYAVSNTDGASLVGESKSSDGYGVQGTSPYIGVLSVGDTTGVYTVSDYGTAVRALTYNGTAVEASTAVAQGYALRVQGAVGFSRSGRATIRAGTDRVTVSTPDLRPGTTVLATLQQYRSGVSVAAAVPDAAHDTLLLVLTKRVPADTAVAWLALD
jgi:hypothetical protein